MPAKPHIALPRLLTNTVFSIVAGALLVVPHSVAAQEGTLEPSNVQDSPVLDSPAEEEPTFDLPVSGRPPGSYPALQIIIASEIENDWTFDSEDDDNELNDLFTTLEPFTVMVFFPPQNAKERSLLPSPVATRASTRVSLADQASRKQTPAIWKS